MRNNVNIGDFDTRVVFKSCVITRGTQGEKVRSFQTFGEAYGKVEHTTAETVDDGNLEAGQTISLTTYKVAALTTRWLVEISGKLYEIRSIDQLDRMSPFFVLGLYAIEG